MAPPMPASPKAEQEMLSKLDEVNSTVNNWLKKIEENKAALQAKKQVSWNNTRSKSANFTN